MRTLYLECNMGAAGDMLMGALLELHPSADNFIEKMNQLGLPGVKLEKESSVKCGIQGTHIKVTVDGKEEQSLDVHHGHMHDNEHSHNHAHTHLHHHTSLYDVSHIIHNLDIPQRVKENALCVYRLIAAAESNAHGKPMEEIHFHEVGTMDAVADVVGVCLLINDLKVDRIVASPVHVGSGNVKCAHGILPVPAPATAYILRGIPIYGGDVKGELCTPTGAALLKHFVDDFSGMPVMQIEKVGYGMGNKEFKIANCVRAMIGITEKQMDEIVELCCNLDDMTAEKIGFVMELMIEQGALDVYTTSVGMKKNRPGIMLTCMCKKADKSKFLHILLKHTTTLGIREYICNRYGLDRSIRVLQTKYGEVHIKTSTGYGVKREKMEYSDLERIAKEQSKSIEEIEIELKNDIM